MTNGCGSSSRLLIELEAGQCRFLISPASVWSCIFWGLPASDSKTRSGRLQLVRGARFPLAYFLDLSYLQRDEKEMCGDSRATEYTANADSGMSTNEEDRRPKDEHDPRLQSAAM